MSVSELKYPKIGCDELVKLNGLETLLKKVCLVQTI